MNRGLFDVENKLWQFLNKMTDLVLLSVLAFVFSIPVVTAGAAQCGFYYGAMRLYEDMDSGVWTDFWHGFCTSIRAGSALWLMQLAAVAVLLLNLWIGLHWESAFAVVLLVLSAVLLVLVLAVCFYAYPIAARYNFSLGKILRDAMSISVGFLPHSFALLVVGAACIAAGIYIPYVAFFMPAIFGYQVARVNVWVFRKFESGETGREHDERKSE